MVREEDSGDFRELLRTFYHAAVEPVLEKTETAADDEGEVGIEVLDPLLSQDGAPVVQALLPEEGLELIQEIDVPVFADQDADQIRVVPAELIDAAPDFRS